MINAGKQFEKHFASSIPNYCFTHRLRDSAQSYTKKGSSFAWHNECDFFVYDSYSHLFYAIECKSTKSKNMSFQRSENDTTSKMIKYHQIQSLTKLSQFNGIISGLVLNFRDELNKTERTYFIQIDDFNSMINDINKHSINEIDIILHNAIKINGIKKRKYFYWDMESLFKKYAKSVKE